MRSLITDAAYLAVAVSFLVGLFTIAASMREGHKNRAKQDRAAAARQFAEAFAAALLWTELPYRVARRTDDTAESMARIADRFHIAQESIEFHQRWLMLESPDVGGHYSALVKAIKQRCGPHIHHAWNRPPVTGPAGMVLGGALYRIDVDAECETLLTAMRDRLDTISVT